MKTAKQAFIALLFALTVAGTHGRAQESWWPRNLPPSYVDKVKTHFEFDKWNGKTVTNYHHAVTNWVMTLPENEYGDFRVYRQMTETNELGIVRSYLFAMESVPDPTHLWRGSVYVFPGVAEAHKYMITTLAGFSVPIKFMESGDKYNVQLGDKWFGICQRQQIAEVQWCRNNVYVRLTSCETNVIECLPLATNLDAQILQESLK